MTQLFKDAVIETLEDARIARVNFEFGPLRVYPSGYRAVARLVADGHIRFELTTGNASYAVGTEPGTPHVWRVHTDMAELDSNGRLMVRGRLGTAARGTIVHEATHALQDYQRLTEKLGDLVTPRMTEGAAYIAGWIARIAWGDSGISPGVDPHRSGVICARWLAKRLFDGEIIYVVPPEEVAFLSRTAPIGTPARYVFNGI